ncbi:MAG TPA: hypothetical protein VMT53_16775 [Terriglobales bacterium]|nr:hypothetical protein [Terriglobales bacterium]
MRTRLLALGLAAFLAMAPLACSKKPADTTSTDNTTTNAPNSTAPNTADNTNQAPPQNAPMAQKAKPEPKPIVLPAGTVLTVRMGEAVGSKISQPGQTFSASLAQPVEVGGKTVIPAGANASGVVADAKPLGRFKGGAALELKLTSVSIRGTDHPIQTSAVSRTQAGKGKRTAVMAGGGAALGALIGGLAGGGKGAAIGALAGGGAGTGGAAFTGNKDIVIPAESAVSFTLSQPLELR